MYEKVLHKTEGFMHKFEHAFILENPSVLAFLIFIRIRLTSDSVNVHFGMGLDYFTKKKHFYCKYKYKFNPIVFR